MLSLSDEPDAEKITTVWRRNGGGSAGNYRLSVEETIQQAEVSAREFIGLIYRVAFDFNIDIGNAIAAFDYPSIMEASVAKALDVEKGTDERKMHFQHSGFVPTSKGINIAIANKNGSEIAQPGEATPHGQLVRRIVRDLPPED